ncbi:hypothetical protein BCGT_0597 [Mycobacterium tuberculosis variant bovis BCG str. ATCC 35743]|nr:hypothetical protein BCGT_0597 [Mycobacterium tuberculosis variant bovis BCG str. ATCC 35743]
MPRGHNQRSFRRTLPATLRAPSAGEPCRPIAHQTQKLSTRRAKRDLYVSVSVLCVPRGSPRLRCVRRPAQPQHPLK